MVSLAIGSESYGLNGLKWISETPPNRLESRMWGWKQLFFQIKRDYADSATP